MGKRAGCGLLLAAILLFVFVLARNIASEQSETENVAMACASMLFGPLAWILVGVV